MKTEKLRVDQQIKPVLAPDSSPRAMLASAASSTAALDVAAPSVSAKRMLHGL